VQWKILDKIFSTLNYHNVLIYNLNGFLFYAAANHTAVTFVYLCYVCDDQLVSYILMRYLYFT